MKVTIAFLTAGLLMLSCQDLPTEPDLSQKITLAAVGSSFQQGAMIERVLKNGSTHSVDYADCCGTMWTTLQRKGADGWEYFEGSHFACIAACSWSEPIASGETITDSIPAWYAGTYRFELQVLYRSASSEVSKTDTIYSHSFVVE